MDPGRARQPRPGALQAAQREFVDLQHRAIFDFLYLRCVSVVEYSRQQPACSEMRGFGAAPLRDPIALP